MSKSKLFLVKCNVGWYITNKSQTLWLKFKNKKEALEYINKKEG